VNGLNRLTPATNHCGSGPLVNDPASPVSCDRTPPAPTRQTWAAAGCSEPSPRLSCGRLPPPGPLPLLIDMPVKKGATPSPSRPFSPHSPPHRPREHHLLSPASILGLFSLLHSTSAQEATDASPGPARLAAPPLRKRPQIGACHRSAPHWQHYLHTKPPSRANFQFSPTR
jgi:hypothetical protein